MTIDKKKEIISWMCEHWQSDDVFDDAVQHLDKSDETINFCEKIASKIEKILTRLPSYLEKELEK